ncbi:MAG: NAD-dependent epimerase/dehydratase family protein [Aeromicrobium sp.]
MRSVVAGGAGFVGSHLTESLLQRGDEVVVLDNFSTGREQNLAHLSDHPGLTVVRADVSVAAEVDGPVDTVFNLASPASPLDYLRMPLETLRVGSFGVVNTLELARAKGSRYLYASTSEVYGDPLVHPQPEEYFGNVNPIGPRGVYDESKRFGEATVSAYRHTHGLDTKIVRIFNTFGPRMRVDDGRAIPNFIDQALRGEPITVSGDGSQTRSICYVDDLVRGLVAMMDSVAHGPINLGNPEEISMLELAGWIRELTGSASPIEFIDRPADDPEVRRPVIERALLELGWQPVIPAEAGLKQTIDSMSRARSRALR